MKKTVWWQIWQVLFILIYILTFYVQEILLLEHISAGQGVQQRTIQEFMSRIQGNLLPEYFFLLFLPLFLVALSLIVFKKWRWYFLFLSALLITALLISDRLYYDFFSTVITQHSFAAVNQVMSIKSSVYGALSITDVFSLIWCLIFFGFGFIYNRHMDASLEKNKSAFIADKVLGILIFFIALYAYNIAFYLPKRYVSIVNDAQTASGYRMIVSKEPIKARNTFIPGYKSTAINFARTFGLMNFHIKDAADFFKSLIESKELRKKTDLPEDFFEYFRKKQMVNQTRSPFYQIAADRNVFLIHFESLNPILINLKLNNLPVTPNLNELAKTHLYFPQILDQTTVGGSSDAEFALLTGTIPSTQKISTFNSKIIPNLPALPKTLKNYGYDTISLHGYDATFWNRNINHPLFGVDTMYFKSAFSADEKIGLGLPDKDFFEQSVELLKENHSDKFFAYFITLSSHFPYNGAPEQYAQLFKDTVLSDGEMLKNYLQLIRYTDDALGNFFSKIKEAGLWEESIFVIYGDHRPGRTDEMVRELREISGKNLISPRYSTVPVFIAIPGEEKKINNHKNQYNDVVGGLYDIFPTILHLIGREIPEGVTGTHLFVPNEKRAPVPVFKNNKGGFVYTGILYQNNGREVVEDKFGYVFNDNPEAILEKDSERHEMFWKAWITMNYHNYIHSANINLQSFLKEQP